MEVKVTYCTTALYNSAAWNLNLQPGSEAGIASDRYNIVCCEASFVSVAWLDSTSQMYYDEKVRKKSKMKDFSKNLL